MKLSANAVGRTAATTPSTALDHTDAPPLVPVDPIIDTDHLARMTLGEESLEREVLHLFECQAEILLRRMANEPPKGVAALAHTLTGSARGIGAWKVAAAAEAVERAAAAPAPVVLTDVMGRLADAVSEAQRAIAELSRPR
jgi:HPt (histidine-containing phosphotransfer) domain-containing protein